MSNCKEVKQKDTKRTKNEQVVEYSFTQYLNEEESPSHRWAHKTEHLSQIEPDEAQNQIKENEVLEANGTVMSVHWQLADPAKVVLALLASHVIAPSVFINFNSTLWAFFSKRKFICQ